MDDFSIDLPEAAAVAAWLERVIAHISDDDTLPMLTCVQITIGDGHLLAVATDRYTLAVSRLDAPTGAVRGTIGVPGQWARDAVDQFGGEHYEYTGLRLTLTGTRLALTPAGYAEPDDTIAAELASEADYDGGLWRPGWRAIVAASLAAPAGTGPVNVAAEYLGRFVPHTSVGVAPDGAITLAEGNAPLPFTVHVPTEHRPIVLLSRDLLGIIAVRRIDRPPQVADTSEGTDPREAWAPILAARERVPA